MSEPSLNILKINASSRAQSSVSRRLTDRVGERLLNENDSANLVARDILNTLPAVSEDWINANFTPADQRSSEQNELLKLSDELVSELRNADVLLIGLPIYNFGIPAALKAWIDLICRAGETFQYTENGPQGLLSGKRAIISVASGGVPVGSDMDHATKYMTQVLGFIGISDVTFVAATGLAQGDPEKIIENAENEIDALGQKLAA